MELRLLLTLNSSQPGPLNSDLLTLLGVPLQIPTLLKLHSIRMESSSLDLWVPCNKMELSNSSLILAVIIPNKTKEAHNSLGRFL